MGDALYPFNDGDKFRSHDEVARHPLGVLGLVQKGSSVNLESRRREGDVY